MRSQYKFNIRHHTQLDFTRIAQDLSYANPMAVVQVGGKTFLLVHPDVESQDAKPAEFQVIPGLVMHRLNNAVVYDCTGNPRGIDAARAEIERVKRSKWKDNSRYHGEVTVTVSKID